MMIKIITILTVALLLLSMVSLGIALMKPVQPESSSTQGKVLAHVVGAPAEMTGKVILNVVPTK